MGDRFPGAEAQRGWAPTQRAPNVSKGGSEEYTRLPQHRPQKKKKTTKKKEKKKKTKKKNKKKKKKKEKKETNEKQEKEEGE